MDIAQDERTSYCGRLSAFALLGASLLIVRLAVLLTPSSPSRPYLLSIYASIAARRRLAYRMS